MEVVRLAAELGVTTLALTDHETTAGLSEAQAEAARLTDAGDSVRVLPGIELGSDTDDGPVDILGYCFDVQNEGLQTRLVALREGRVERARQMVEKLGELGVPVTWDRVRELAGNSVIGRPHIAHGLLDAGHVDTLTEAFERWIGSQAPAYVARERLTPEEAIRLVRGAGGVPVLAHPVRSRMVSHIPALAEVGLGGLEVYYPHRTRPDRRRLLRLCKLYDLVATGGSDFHGLVMGSTAPLGSVHVPPGSLTRLGC